MTGSTASNGDHLLRGSVALVTGGSLGIGRAAAAGLGRAGAAVAICGSNAEHVTAAVEALRGEGLTVEGFVADVARPDDVERLVRDTVEAFGGLDILVNSAGIQRYGTAPETTVATWDEVFDVNVRSMFLTAKFAIPEMRRRGGGSIVNVSSVQAFTALRGSVAYVASKGAINALTRALAQDHAPDGIRVNAVCPGSVDTPMLRWAADQFRGERPQDDLVAEWGTMHPMGRVARPEEVADLIVYLAGPHASFITGAAVPVDGGLLTTVAVALASAPES
jgi:NAD(P)-dependent dehydrogenase (short-subunit alcohol dehydrogenase family)